MLHFCLTTQQASGNIITGEVYPGSSFGDVLARVSNTPTLDGGNFVAHYGICAGDTPITLSAQLTAAQQSTLAEMMADYTEFTLSIGSALYVGMIESVTGSGTQKTIKLQVSEKYEIY